MSRDGVEPQVFLVAETQLAEGFGSAIRAMGAQDWKSEAHSPAELLAEFAGRLCYRSWKPGLNPNLTKVREGNAQYLANILESRHGSVLEHASVTFLFWNVSRVFTHELVRHRAGVAISQESLRFVRLQELKFWWPAAMREDAELTARGTWLLEQMEEFQRWMAERFGLDDPGRTFPFKKALTSAMRRFAPLGLGTAILWTTNLRNLRFVLELRTAAAAEEEIRLVFDAVGFLVRTRYPNIFADFTRTEEGEWKPKHSKI